MSRLAHYRFAFVVALFACHGALPVVLSSWVPNTNPPFWEAAARGWLMAIACWWAAWPVLRAGSRWRAWLEGLTLIGVTYGSLLVAGAIAAIVRNEPHSQGDANFATFIEHLVMSVAIIEVVILMIVFAGARLITGCRLLNSDETPEAANQFSLRGLCLLIVVVAGHTCYLQELFREALLWEWHRIDQWFLTEIAGRLALYAIPTVLIFVPAIQVALGDRSLLFTVPLFGLSGCAGIWIVLLITSTETLVESTLGLCLGLSVNAVFTALVLRLLGFRIAFRSLASFVGKTASDPGCRRAVDQLKLVAK